MLKELKISIDIDRLWERHNILAKIGQTSNTGVNRQALSDDEIQARKQIIYWAKQINLEITSDKAANIFFKLPGIYNNRPSVMTGSHIDSQPTGGRYDGVLGVLAGLEVLETIVEHNIKICSPIEVVNWMNEEGSRFAPGMMGSAVFSGVRKLKDILDIEDSNGVKVSTEIKKLNNELSNIEVIECGQKIKSFIELHIEQGPILEDNNKHIGIVTGMQGKKTYLIEIIGKEDHVGTTPKSLRKDALMSSVKVLNELYNILSDEDDMIRFSVGKFVVFPNAPSVVPSKINFSIDLRHPENSKLMKLDKIIKSTILKFSNPCRANVKSLVNDDSVKFPDQMVSIIEKNTKKLGFSFMRINSGAGHDSKHINKIAPSGMIFIPCKKGVSHHPDEQINKNDMYKGTMVLAETLIELANNE